MSRHITMVGLAVSGFRTSFRHVSRHCFLPVSTHRSIGVSGHPSGVVSRHRSGMSTYNKNRAIVLSITEGGLTPTEAAKRFEVSTRWIRTLTARYRAGGLKDVDPQSKRPHTNPNATDASVIDQILTLRAAQITQGLDAGPESIWHRLPEATRPSTATIWRILRRNDQITNQPQKRPRSSWHRFEAAAPNHQPGNRNDHTRQTQAKKD